MSVHACSSQVTRLIPPRASFWHICPQHCEAHAGRHSGVASLAAGAMQPAALPDAHSASYLDSMQSINEPSVRLRLFLAWEVREQEPQTAFGWHQLAWAVESHYQDALRREGIHEHDHVRVSGMRDASLSRLRIAHLAWISRRATANWARLVTETMRRP